jgi:hypothetical protein
VIGNTIAGTDREGYPLADRIPDDAVVVRGGLNLPDGIRRGMNVHPCGVTGISVECGSGVPVVELAVALPHGRVGVTTVGAVRAAGGDVIRTSGRTPYHATLTGLTPEAASRLLTPTIPNPGKDG